MLIYLENVGGIKMYYIISIKNRDLKWIRVVKDKQEATKILNTQENDFREREMFTNKLVCAKALKKYCDNFCCNTIKSCIDMINIEKSIAKKY